MERHAEAPWISTAGPTRRGYSVVVVFLGFLCLPGSHGRDGPDPITHRFRRGPFLFCNCLQSGSTIAGSRSPDCAAMTKTGRRTLGIIFDLIIGRTSRQQAINSARNTFDGICPNAMAHARTSNTLRGSSLCELLRSPHYSPRDRNGLAIARTGVSASNRNRFSNHPFRRRRPASGCQ